VDMITVSKLKKCKTVLEFVRFPIVVKTCRESYDDRGQMRVSGAEDVEEASIFVEKISILDQTN
jgi:phosphoribosylaminoimidazole carboxylase (NCAIR synthetase)